MILRITIYRHENDNEVLILFEKNGKWYNEEEYHIEELYDILRSVVLFLRSSLDHGKRMEKKSITC